MQGDGKRRTTGTPNVIYMLAQSHCILEYMVGFRSADVDALLIGIECSEQGFVAQE